MRLVDCNQYESTYWAAHCGKPGASDACSVATPAKGDYPASAKTLIAQLIADKHNPVYGMHDETATLAMKTGLWMEPKARDFLEFELDVEIVQVGLCVADDEFFVCSPDGLIGDDAGIELKVPTGATHVGYLLHGGLPDKYKPQVHWSMIVTGRKIWYWASWNPFLPPVIVRVEPDDYTETLRANMARFKAEYHESAAKIDKLFPAPPEPVVQDFGSLGTLETIPGAVEPLF